ncbi:MAG: TrkA family potassium uptake protein [Chloroflexi bacterium]|nr:TrkA family potassium uptake protein [Chloroflexota bacterium]
MYIIVVGGGKVGFYLSRQLLAEGHEILVIEKDARKCEGMCEELGNVVMYGDGCEAQTLDDAGTARADMLIAVTGDDEDNLVACQVAKHKFNVPRTLARINNPKNEGIFKKLGIDFTVNSTDLILEHIEAEVPSHPLVHLLTLPLGNLEIVQVKIPKDGQVVGKLLKDIVLPPDSILSLVISKDKGPQVPGADTMLSPGDEVVAVTKVENEEALRNTLISVRG